MGLHVGMNCAEASKTCSDDRETLGRLSGCRSRGAEPAPRIREATGGEPPTMTGHRVVEAAPEPSEARRSTIKPMAQPREPAADVSPTAATPTRKGRQNFGPEAMPTRKALETSRIKSSTIRLPCPLWLKRVESVSRLPRAESMCRMIASPRGKASEPKARNAPVLGIIVPIKTGSSGTIDHRLSNRSDWMREMRSLSRRKLLEEGESRRSLLDGAQTGAAPGRVAAEESFDSACDLHQVKGTVQQEGREHTTPYQIEPFEAICKMRDSPEDSQACEGSEEPAQGGSPVECCR